MKIKILFLVTLFALSACGVSENPASNGNLTEICENMLIESIEINDSELKSYEENDNSIAPPDETEHELEQEEIVEPKILEPFIVMGSGYDFFTYNYIIRVVSLDGTVKEMEYEHESIDEHYNIDMYKFANVIYNQMNDDNITVTVILDKIPDNIVELARVVETLELDKSVGFGAENWTYYIIIGTDEDRRAVMIGGKWGSGGSLEGGANELTRAINEYLETTERRVP